MSLTTPLSSRELSDIPCACGCGALARVGSKYNSRHCTEVACKKNYRQKHFKKYESTVIPVIEDVVTDTRTWDERWRDIYAKYGVNRDRR